MTAQNPAKSRKTQRGCVPMQQYVREPTESERLVQATTTGMMAQARRMLLTRTQLRDRNNKLTVRRLSSKAEAGLVGGRKLVKERPGGTSNGIGWPLPRCECSGSQREA